MSESDVNRVLAVSQWRASYARACRLADTLDFGDEARIIIDLGYGEITEEEAETRLNEIGEDVLAGNEEFETHTET